MPLREALKLRIHFGLKEEIRPLAFAMANFKQRNYLIIQKVCMSKL
jgi:hypothetical protein